MNREALQEDYECLGVAAGDTLAKVREAYRQMKTLYGAESLATYALFDDEDRLEKLDHIEQSYLRICRELASPPPNAGRGEEISAVSAPSLEGEHSPGLCLKRAREHAGISLKEVADRTKISTRKLQDIETETFDRLPAPVFLRGFVDQFARLVGVANPAELAQAYLDRYRQEVQGA